MRIVLLPLALIATPVAAQPALEDLGALTARMSGEVGPVRPLDPRLRLARCPSAAELEPGDGFVTVRCPAIGWKVRAVMLAPPTVTRALVKRGDAVDLVVRGSGFSLSTSAIAQADAGSDGAVRVKTATGTIVTGRATADGTVEIGR